MRISNILLLTTLVTACATAPAERAAQTERKVDEMIQVYGPACNKLGYQQNTDSWRGCVLYLATQNDLKRYDRHYYYPMTTQCIGHRGFFNCTTF